MTHTVGPRETAWLLPALQVGSDDSHCRLSIWHGLGAWKSDFFSHHDVLPMHMKPTFRGAPET